MNTLIGEMDAQQGVVDPLVAIGVHDDRLRQNGLDFVGHDAELPAKAGDFAEFWLVVEQIEAETGGVGADADDVFL